MSDTPDPLHIHFRFLTPYLMDIRTRLPAEALSRDPELVISEGLDLKLGSLPAATPKIVVHQRSSLTDEESERRFLESTARMIRHGWISVLEYDDHPELATKYVGGMTEFSWRHFSHYHGIQVSKDPLVGVFARWNPNIAVFPNAVFSLPPLRPKSATPKIFYGALARGPFALEVVRSLKTAIEAFSSVEFVVIGDRAVFDAIPTQNKRFHEKMPYDDYMAVMRDCDISLSPLTFVEGMDCKSDAKFLDAAQNGVVLVASPTVYAETIVDGQTGFIANSLEDWPRIVSMLLADRALLTRVSANAHKYVEQNRMFELQVAKRREWYKMLWAQRHVLTRQLIDREPKLHRMLFG